MTRSRSSLRMFSKTALNGIVIALISLVAAGCIAQEKSNPTPLPSAPTAQQRTQPPDNTRIVVPVGTEIPLVLTRSLNSHSVNAGDSVFAQVSTPVMMDDQVAIPAGTFVRGKVNSLKRNGTRADLLMRSASLVMGTAAVDLGGPVKIESEEWTAYNNPSDKSKAAIILAPLLGTGLGIGIGAAIDKPHTVTIGGGTVSGPGIGTLPGPTLPVSTLTFTENTHRGLFIGSAVGGALGLIASFTFMARSHDFYLEEGSPLHMTLTTPVSLTQAQSPKQPIAVLRFRSSGEPDHGPGRETTRQSDFREELLPAALAVARQDKSGAWDRAAVRLISSAMTTTAAVAEIRAVSAKAVPEVLAAAQLGTPRAWDRASAVHRLFLTTITAAVADIRAPSAKAALVGAA